MLLLICVAEIGDGGRNAHAKGRRPVALFNLPTRLFFSGGSDTNFWDVVVQGVKLDLRREIGPRREA